MNGMQNSRTRNNEKPFPGCLGRMVNIFDLSTGLAGNKLLTDKPHCDGSPLSRGQSDAAGTSPVTDPIEDKAIVSELIRRSPSNKKTNGTPMKMLIAQEMSKEGESKHNPPSVVAKLMGLDALPRQQSDSAAKRSLSRCHSRCHSGSPLDYWQQQEHALDMQMQREIHHRPEQNEYKDVYEIWQQSQKGSYSRGKSPQKGRDNENINEKKMALVRQKFTEAKRLATDEKLRQSEQFQDALEVLSSNKDLFLKFLQEPNSLFSQHLYDLQSATPPAEAKCITVLRPTKMVDNDKFSGSEKKNERQRTNSSHEGQIIGWERSTPGFSPLNWQVNDNPTQTTRIVVLKPSLGKPHEIKAVVSPSSPRLLHSDNLYGDPEDDEAQESREVAKEITSKMCENLGGHRRDETSFSSVFSNGYIGDDSSFNKSENEYAVGNQIDSEVVSPTSRHSWEYTNMFGSPYSSSFSHASYSPESSVCREAKKRLSERWALMAANGNCPEQRHVRRSSSTLGEMLALSDAKNSRRSEEEGSNKEQEPRGPMSCFASDFNKVENVDNSPRNLLRSKSVPASSTVFGCILNVEASDHEAGKTDICKEVAKERSTKSSLTQKVTSLFFSRNKKSSKEESSAIQSKNESQKSAGIPIQSPEKISDDTSQFANDRGIERGSVPSLQGSTSKTSSSDLIGIGQKQGVICPEASLSVKKPSVPGIPSENQDQPSPISVLEPLSEEDDNVRAECCNAKANKHGRKLVGHSIKSNLIDKSPPIGSIARTLSWDDSCVEIATSYPLEPSLVSRGAEEEEREWLVFVQSLLSLVGLDDKMQPDSFYSRWHSLESPLDPSLRDKYINLNENEIMHECKLRERRSMLKLVFDCVNTALADITGYGLDTRPRTIPLGAVHSRLLDGASPKLVDQVQALVKEWLSCKGKCVSDDGEDSHSLVVEKVARKDVVGKGWVEHMRLEMDHVEMEIEGTILEELVQEAVAELTGKM